MADPNKLSTSEGVQTVTPAMQAAWMEYEPPERFASAIEHPFAVAAVRDAFYSGYVASLSRHPEQDAGKREWTPHLDYSGEPMREGEFRDAPNESGDVAERAAEAALDLFGEALRGVSADLRADSDDVADALLGVAEGINERRAKMVRDICARAASAPTPPSQGA